MLYFDRLKARFASGAPVFLMLGTFGLAGVVYDKDGSGADLVGFAQGIPETVAALERARVSALHVTVGSAVEAGQVVASLDASVLDAEIAIAQAEKVRLEAQVRAEQSNIHRRLDVDRDGIEREVFREREDLHRLTAEAKVLESEIARVAGLVAEHQAVASDLVEMKLRHAQLQSQIAEKPRTMQLLGKQLAAASQRRDEVVDVGRAPRDRLDAELLVVERRIELLDKRRANYVLRATRKGKVAAVEKQPGETASVGDAIVKLVSATNRVSVCVPEERSLGLHENDAAVVWARGARTEPLVGKTVAIGPTVAELPARCWRSPNVPSWGREALVELEGAPDVVVGEAFSVKIGGSHPSVVAPNPGLPVAKAGDQLLTSAVVTRGSAALEPRSMTVPHSLARRTRFEPSAVLAQKREGRYVVASDDTGIDRSSTEGRPWLFAMNAEGAVSSDPIVIQGIDSIDDVEAMAVGDEGETYVLSSQSHGKRGTRSAARAALLRLRSDGEGFRVDGQVRLAELLDASPEHAARLGLANGTRDLDLEGMTFSRGALYVGVKAPLDAKGRAIIWKIGSPAALFARSPDVAAVLRGAAIEKWATARVDVEIDGRTLPGGISELLFRDPDSLVIASTPSNEEGAAAGALWRADHARDGGELAVHLVHRFPGLKPEGLSPSLSTENLLVVFDAGRGTPSFLEMPWPP